MEHHHFTFSTKWSGHNRLCGTCGQTYGNGLHIEITDLKPYTSYVCPTGGGRGHSSRWTGAYARELRSPRDAFCGCGERLVEEDQEKWLLSWELADEVGWHRVEVIRSRHGAEQQKVGLEQLIDQGEPIRNVALEQLITSGGVA